MSVRIICGDALTELRKLPDESVHCCVTSPPYFGLRDYGVDGQIGLGPDFRDYIAMMLAVFREVRRALRQDGTLWLNLGDSYAWEPKVSCLPAGLKPKDLVGIPWRVAFALQADGWWLRSDIIWSKPNPMPESVTDRPTKAHEYLFLLSRSERYYYDAEAIAESANSFGRQHSAGEQSPKTKALKALGFHNEGGDLNLNYERESRNKRSVWTVATAPYSGAHFATFPPALIEPCILAGSSTETCETCGAAWRMLPPESGLMLDGIEVTPAKPTRSWCGHDAPSGPPSVVLDPFGGAGTTGLVADRLCRNALVIELNPAYADMARSRIRGDAPLLTEVA